MFLYNNNLVVTSTLIYHKQNRIDTPGVIQKVSELFKAHTHLILGFNSFLPPGYKIVLENKETNAVETTTSQKDKRKKKAPSTPPPAQPPASASSSTTSAIPSATTKQNDRSIDFDQAISYVTKIKKRFAESPSMYKSFLDILHNYQKEQTTIKRVYEQVSELFVNHQDLLSEFTQFLPMPVEKKAGRKVKKVCYHELFHSINT